MVCVRIQGGSKFGLAICLIVVEGEIFIVLTLYARGCGGNEREKIRGILFNIVSYLG